MLSGCRTQLRMGPGGPIGLDFGAIMQVGRDRGADPELLAALLPHASDAILNALLGESAEEEA